MLTYILTQDRLKELFKYDEKTGVFTRIKLGNGRAKKIGHVKRCDGSLQMRVDKVLYRASRLAWLYVNGEFPKYITHKNNDKQDNAISNLEEKEMPNDWNISFFTKHLQTRKKRPELTKEMLREYFEYEKSSGDLIRIKVPDRARNVKIGDIAGGVCNHSESYKIGYFGKQYKASTLVWLYHKGELPTDRIIHKDGNPFNCSIENLKLRGGRKNEYRIDPKGS